MYAVDEEVDGGETTGQEWPPPPVVVLQTNNTIQDITDRILYSRYLAQNAAIWLADEVLRDCGHDTSRCQYDKISWNLIRNNQKDVSLAMDCILLPEKASQLKFIFKSKEC